MKATMRITPERKLLEMIEGSSPASVAVRHRTGGRGIAVDYQRLMRRALVPFLSVCLGVSAAFFLIRRHPVSVVRGSEKIEETVAVPAAAVEAVESAVTSVPAAAGTAASAQESVPATDNTAAKERAVQPARISGSSKGPRVEDLRLVGISWSESPDALIEDVSRKVTLFLKEGQVLEGGILVKEISKTRVLIESHGRMIELQ